MMSSIPMPFQTSRQHARRLGAVAAPIVLLVGMSIPALGACPPGTTASTADTLKDNQDRLVCLQQDIGAATTARRQDERLRQLENGLNNLQIQRRFDNLPVYQPPRIGF